MNLDDEKINLGKKSYKEYLIAAYGTTRARYMTSPAFRNKVDKFKRAPKNRPGGVDNSVDN